MGRFYAISTPRSNFAARRPIQADFEEGFSFVCVGLDITLYARLAARLVTVIKS